MDGFRETVRLKVLAENEPFLEEAGRLAAHLGAEAVLREKEWETEDLVLRLDSSGLTLMGKGLELKGDLGRMIPRLRYHNLTHELVVKAAGRKDPAARPLAADATAGLGEDSLLLAGAGFRVRMYEYNPVTAALLRDSLRRAGQMPELEEAVGRMELFEEDSLQALRQLPERPDLVLLDPMFPERHKSGLIKKKLQLLQLLEKPCAKEEELLEAALASGPRRIVIKRPKKGPWLAGRKPSYSIEGKMIRYDCLVLE